MEIIFIHIVCNNFIYCDIFFYAGMTWGLCRDHPANPSFQAVLCKKSLDGIWSGLPEGNVGNLWMSGFCQHHCTYLMMI